MILYHGTSEENWPRVRESGVRKFSYWTHDLNSALTMGGPIVIAAFFAEATEEWLGKGGWQWRNDKKISPSKFISVRRFKESQILYNPKANDAMRRHYDEVDGKKRCKACDGHGELTYLDDGHWWRIGGCRFDGKVYKKPSRSGDGKVKSCPKCGGYGSVEEYRKMQEG